MKIKYPCCVWLSSCHETLLSNQIINKIHSEKAKIVERVEETYIRRIFKWLFLVKLSFVLQDIGENIVGSLHCGRDIMGLATLAVLALTRKDSSFKE